MARKLEIGFGALSLVCFAGAVDTALGTGVIDLLLHVPGPPEVFAQHGVQSLADGGQRMQPLLFLSAGLAFAGIALFRGNIPGLPNPTTVAGAESRERRRLIAAIVYIARSCAGALPSDVAEAFRATTGRALEQGEIARAASYLKSSRTAALERILAGASGSEEKRRILAAASRVWVLRGMDSETATKALERVSTALGLEGDDVPAALDTHWTQNASRLLRDVETMARRTMSRATFEVIRITSRGRRMD